MPSRGTPDLGVGSGVGDDEFLAVWGTSRAQASAQSREVFEILRQVFDDGVVNFHGEFYDYDSVVVSPPAERPARDIIWAAAGRNAIELAKNHGYRLMIPRPLPLDERLGSTRSTGRSRARTARSSICAAASSPRRGPRLAARPSNSCASTRASTSAPMGRWPRFGAVR